MIYILLHIYFICILCLGQIPSYLMTVLIIRFMDLSEREETHKCKKSALVFVHPMPWCLSRWVFCSKLDLKKGKYLINLLFCSFSPCSASAGCSWGMKQLQRRVTRSLHLPALLLLYSAFPNTRMLQEYLVAFVGWGKRRHRICFP